MDRYCGTIIGVRISPKCILEGHSYERKDGGQTTGEFCFHGKFDKLTKYKQQ